MEDLRERPCKLINKELQSWDLDNLTCEDIEAISRNMHKTRSCQLLLFRTGIEETYEALPAIQVLTSSKEDLLMTRKKYCNVFLQNQRTVF